MSFIVEGLINGIDLCSLQDKVPINAQAIADAGFEFAYVKSSQYSSTKDNRFGSLVDRLQKAGIWCGAYHFMSHDTDPLLQAQFFYRASGGLGKNPGELPPMCDWEYCTETVYVPPKYPLGHPRHCVDFAERFCDEAERLWFPQNNLVKVPRNPVLYTYPDYSRRHQPALAGSSLAKYPLCYASYKSKPAANGKGYELVPWLPLEHELPLHKTPLPWTKPKLVQYSGDKGLRVPGIAGDCDRQVFLGSQGDWAEFRGIERPLGTTVGPAAQVEFRRASQT